MQITEANDKPYTKQQRSLLNGLKQWYDQNEVHLSPLQGKALHNFCLKIHNTFTEQIKELSARLQEVIKERTEISDKLIEYQKESSDLKLMLDRKQQQKREISERFEESVSQMEREKHEISIEVELKQQFAQQNQQLSMILSQKYNEINDLNNSISILKSDITEIKMRDSRLISNNQELKVQREKFKITSEHYQTLCQKYKREIQTLRHFQQERNELNKRFRNNGETIYSEGNAEQCSFDGYSQDGDDDKASDDDRQLLSHVQNNYVNDTQSNSGYFGKRYQGISPKQSQTSHSKISIRSGSQVSMSELSQFKRSKNEKIYPNMTVGNERFINFLNGSQITRKKSMALSPHSKLKAGSANNSKELERNKQEQGRKQNHHINNYREDRRNQHKWSPNEVRGNRFDDEDDLVGKLQYYKKVVSDQQKQFVEMRMEKQYFEILSRTQKQQYRVKENAYRKIFAQKMNELLSVQNTKTSMLETRLSDQIGRLNDLNQDILGEQIQNLKKKDQVNHFNIMINNLGSQDLLSENPRGFRNQMDTSRHNISQDHIEHIEPSGFSQLELDSQPSNQKVLLSNSQILQENRQGSSNIIVEDEQVQTDQIICFKDDDEGIQRGFKRFVQQDSDVDTENHDEKENVGVQVGTMQIGIEEQSQTDISLNTTQQFDKTNITAPSYEAKIQTQKEDNQLEKYEIKLNDSGVQVFQTQDGDNQTDQILTDEAGSQSYQVHEDKTQTQGKKKFKIQLCLQSNLNQFRQKDSENCTSSRIQKSTAYNSSMPSTQRQQFTDRKHRRDELSMSSSVINENIERKRVGNQSQTQENYTQTESQGLDSIGGRKGQNMMTRESEGSKEGSENYNQLHRILELDSYERSSEQFISTPKSIKQQLDDDQDIEQKGGKTTAGKTEASSEIKNHKDFSSFKETKRRLDSGQQFSQKEDQGEVQITTSYKQDNEKQYSQGTSNTQPRSPLFNKLTNVSHAVKNRMVEQSQITHLPLNSQDNHSKSANLLQPFKGENNPSNAPDEDISSPPQKSPLSLSESQKIELQRLRTLSHVLHVDPRRIRLSGKENPKSSIWSINEIYLAKVYLEKGSEGVTTDELLIWKRGAFSLKTGKYLRMTQKGTFIKDSSAMALGNSQITAWKDLVWIRRKSEDSQMEGTLQSANWKVLTRQTLTII